LFQPLLYQVATAGLSPAQIAAPIRSILRGQTNVTVRLARVIGIDKARHQVMTDDGCIDYDWLIVATGARHAYFGHDEWEAYAQGLKRIDDATAIRRRILTSFEKAESAAADMMRRRELNFVIVGGGPTGVELAGAIAELARTALAADFRNIDPRRARVILLEAGDRLLAAFPPSLSAKAKRSLEKLGVEVRLGAAVTDCTARGVAIGDRDTIESDCVIWAAGVAASPAAKWLGAEQDRAGRVKVNPDLSLPGYPEIFVIGDTALVLGADGRPVPGLAPAAKQQGACVAAWMRRKLAGGRPPERFRYRASAVADFGRIRISGYPAWLLWGLVHVFFLIGFRNRIAVLMEWLWAYVTFQRGARLITGSHP
ncbi:MAG TPA: NAD(P)/FAD-dependent oxidoreductase, partial [Dongiaceae bacterium]|nr:NAD(P)/FAD-dependent oxidoreductase [Dongiaceae bacterium]